MLRRLAERLSRDLTLRRRLPAEFGRAPILVTPSAGLRYITRRMDAVDPVLMGLAREFVKPGAVVWDVGANVGLFAFAAASLAGPGGQVVAMEPDAWLVQLLRRSAANATGRFGAGANHTGGRRLVAVLAHRFCLAERSRAANHLVRIRHDPDGRHPRGSDDRRADPRLDGPVRPATRR